MEVIVTLVWLVYHDAARVLVQILFEVTNPILKFVLKKVESSVIILILSLIPLITIENRPQ